MAVRIAKTPKPRLLWWWRHDILNSGLQPRVRLLLLTAAHHMTDNDDSCFTSTRLLARETGMNAEQVTEALRQAAENGTLEVRVIERDQMCLTRVYKR